MHVENLVTGDHSTLPNPGGFALGDGLLVYYDFSANSDALVAVNLSDGTQSVLKTIGSNSTGPGYQALHGRQLTWVEVQFGSHGQDTYTIYSAEIIPEPSIMAFVALGLLGVHCRCRNRRMRFSHST